MLYRLIIINELSPGLLILVLYYTKFDSSVEANNNDTLRVNYIHNNKNVQYYII